MLKPARIFFFIVVILLISSLVFSGYLYNQLNNLKSERDSLSNEKSGFGLMYDQLSKQLREKDEAPNVQKESGKYNTFTMLSKCNMALSYPDETKTFFGESGTATSGPYSRAWRLNYKLIGNSDKFSDSYSIFKGGHNYYLILRNDDEASGYVSALIDIRCIENKEGKSLDEMTTKYLKLVSDNNIAMESVTGVKAKSLVVKKESTLDLWKTKVDKLTINRNSIAESTTTTEYMLINKNMIILISQQTGTGDKKALNSLKSIIDSIYLY